MGLFLYMVCNKKLFNKFFLISSIFLLLTICCNNLLVSATIPRENIRIEDSAESVQVQQKIIINRLNRIEHRLEVEK
jgi:hypothetical protein